MPRTRNKGVLLGEPPLEPSLQEVQPPFICTLVGDYLKLFLDKSLPAICS